MSAKKCFIVLTTEVIQGQVTSYLVTAPTYLSKDKAIQQFKFLVAEEIGTNKDLDNAIENRYFDSGDGLTIQLIEGELYE